MEPKIFLSCYFEKKYTPRFFPERYINYRGKKVLLTEENYDELKLLFPSFWHTDADRLLRFEVYEDGRYDCLREKSVYNFATKQTEEKLYKFDNARKEKVDDLLAVISSYYESLQTRNIEEYNQKVLDSLSKLEVIKSLLLSMRKKFLQDSDYLFTSDYLIDESVKQQWVDYRQALRDITEQPAWKENRLTEIEFPVSPSATTQQLESMYMMFNQALYSTEFTNEIETVLRTVEGVTPDQYIRNFVQVQIKTDILRTIRNLKIPDLDTAFFDSDNYDFTFAEQTVSSFEDLVIKLNAYESEIDQKLSSVNMGFTVADLIKQVSDKISDREEVLEVITDLNGG